MKRLPITLITLYQLLLSPFLGSCCRFYPSCSEYTKQAIQKHGFWKGTWIGIKRICRCNRWHPGGHDPVP